MEEGDLDAADFPNAKKFHWRLFWKKMEKAKQDGVQLPAVALPAGKLPEAASAGNATNRHAMHTLASALLFYNSKYETTQTEHMLSFARFPTQTTFVNMATW